MELISVITGCFTGLIALISGVYASFTARKKGPILSNSYLWASKEKRAKLDKDTEYRLVTVIYGCISMIFALSTLHIFTGWQWALILMYFLLVFVVIYAIVHTIKNANQTKN